MKDPQIKKKQTDLSDNHYILNKVTFDYQKMTILGLPKKEVMTEEMDLQYYFTTQKKTVILTRQFRLPTYLNGNKTGMMIEVCAGMLDQDNAEQCDKRNRRRNWISPHNSSQDRKPICLRAP
jgi:hypothetical protein